MTDSSVTNGVTDRDEQWRQFYADQMERQTKAIEATAKKISTIEAVLAAWFTLTILAGVIVVIASLASS